MKRESSSIVDSAAVVPYSSLKTRKKYDSNSALFDILASHDDQSNYSLPLSTLQARDKASITLAYNHLSSLSVPSSIDQIYYTNGWSLETSLSKLCARGYDKISLPLASLIIARSKEEPGHPSPCAGPRPCLLKAVNGVVSDLNFLRLLIREFPPALTVTWSGSTALDFARSRANEEVISLIEVCTEAYKARSWRDLFRICGRSDYLCDEIARPRVPFLIFLRRRGEGCVWRFFNEQDGDKAILRKVLEFI